MYYCFRLLYLAIITTLISLGFSGFAEEVSVLDKAWWLNANDPASIFHSKKGFKHLQFNNKDEIVIAILDSGVDFNHPYLKKHHFKRGGKPADFNFYTGTNDDSDLIDHQGHGTHVAGITLAAIKKVNPKANVKLISLKVMADPLPPRQSYAESKKLTRKDPSMFGYYTKEAARYLIKLKREGVNILALNASFGGEEFDQKEFEAVKDLLANDILVVAAAGNDGVKLKKDGNKFYPAAYSTELPGVISVGNLTKNGELSKSSNYGNIVSILAPGSDIMAPVPKGKYSLKSGTSMATPQVTAAVSLLKALHPELNTLEIKNHLLKNSRFNESYMEKVGSATRLDMNLLFRPVSSKYDFDAVKSLPVTKFYSKKGRIIKNTPCVKAPGSKFLCGDVYNKVISTSDKNLKSIADIAAEDNTESLINSYMGVNNGGRIIESSLSSLIHSFTKNDSIHQQMLSDGFAFKDLYLNLGPGMLDKYYKGHVIIPVLTKEEFLSYYPFGIKTDKQKSLAYAKYIDGLLNSGPQFLDQVGPLFLTRATPLDSVEASLVQSFPLPISSYIANYMAQKRTPDMVSVAKSMTESDLKNLNDQKAAKTLKAMKAFKVDLKLTKKDIAYLRSLGKAYRQGTKELASSLGSGSSVAAGISPKLKSIRREAEKNMMTPVKVKTVAGAPPIDKNQKSLPKLSPKTSSALFVASNAVRSMASRKMIAAISNVTNSRMPSSVKRLKANFKYKGRSISSVTELSEQTIKRVKEQQSESQQKNYDKQRKSRAKIANLIGESDSKEKVKFNDIDMGVSDARAVRKKNVAEDLNGKSSNSLTPKSRRKDTSKKESLDAHVTSGILEYNATSQTDKTTLMSLKVNDIENETGQTTNLLRNSNFICSGENIDVLINYFHQNKIADSKADYYNYCFGPKNFKRGKYPFSTMDKFNPCIDYQKRLPENASYKEAVLSSNLDTNDITKSCDKNELLASCKNRIEESLLKVCQTAFGVSTNNLNKCYNSLNDTKAPKSNSRNVLVTKMGASVLSPERLKDFRDTYPMAKIKLLLRHPKNKIYAGDQLALKTSLIDESIRNNTQKCLLEDFSRDTINEFLAWHHYAKSTSFTRRTRETVLKFNAIKFKNLYESHKKERTTEALKMYCSAKERLNMYFFEENENYLELFNRNSFSNTDKTENYDNFSHFEENNFKIATEAPVRATLWLITKERFLSAWGQGAKCDSQSTDQHFLKTNNRNSFKLSPSQSN